MADRRLAPEDRPKACCTAGTSTTIPTRPYTTEGMPASRDTAERITAATLLLATLARNMAVSTPTGTPMRMAPPVPATEVRMKGRMPNWSCRAAQVSPRRKSATPISSMAGRPETTRYTLMNSTQATAKKPHRKKKPCTENSSTSRAVCSPNRFFKRVRAEAPFTALSSFV